jgi:gluconate 2-dehydrogenase gamma chain
MAEHMSDEQVQDRLTARRLSRRRFLAASASTGVAAASVAGTLASAAAAQPASTDAHASHALAEQQQASNPLSDGFSYFNTFQAQIVNAAAARIIPTDENGPGAVEAGVVYFIDRQLSNEYGFGGRRYTQGPFQQGTATQGDQSGMDMRDRYRLGIFGMDRYAQQLYQKGFAQLTADQQDRVLRDMEAGVPTTFDGNAIQSATTDQAPSGTENLRQMSPGSPGIGATAFFNLLRSHVIAGFFADPVHGGNRDMVGWKLIGFPGAQFEYRDNILQYGQPYQGGYVSLAQYQGQYAQ